MRIALNKGMVESIWASKKLQATRCLMMMMTSLSVAVNLTTLSRSKAL